MQLGLSSSSIYRCFSFLRLRDSRTRMMRSHCASYLWNATQQPTNDHAKQTGATIACQTGRIWKHTRQATTKGNLVAMIVPWWSCMISFVLFQMPCFANYQCWAGNFHRSRSWQCRPLLGCRRLRLLPLARKIRIWWLRWCHVCIAIPTCFEIQQKEA